MRNPVALSTSLPVALSVLFAASCSTEEIPLIVRWTVDGVTPSSDNPDACGPNASVRIDVLNHGSPALAQSGTTVAGGGWLTGDSPDPRVVEDPVATTHPLVESAPYAPPLEAPLDVVATTTVACTDAQAAIRVLATDEIFVTLLRDETAQGGGIVEAGRAAPIPVPTAPRFLDAYGEDTQFDRNGDPIRELVAPVQSTVGRLQADFTFAGVSCSDAGVSTASVALLRETSSLTFDTVEETDISCDNGEMRYSYFAADLGARYYVVIKGTGTNGTYTSPVRGFRIAADKPIVAVKANLTLE